ncbi:hypothetical protein NDU88_005477 [Pleurodeles waltl]|uniref:Peptidase A2 domain-containing protein n=1 Tax=Pleurodeles waltl TaxID=8319 RepID=A0AAV7QLB6_PLEWA|nr:hypothetical protein NDU88_005477 [Pleurodeles waltl]
MSRSRPQKVKTVQSVQPVIVMDDDDLDDDGNGDGTVHIIHALQPGGHPRKRVPRCSVLLAGHKVDALIDTGASINVIATSVLQRIPFQLHLRPTTTQCLDFVVSSYCAYTLLRCATPQSTCQLPATKLSTHGHCTRSGAWFAWLRVSGVPLWGRPGREMALAALCLGLQSLTVD